MRELLDTNSTMIRFLCKTCRLKIKIEEKYANRNIQCPHCKSVNRASERLPLTTPALASTSAPSEKTSDTVILLKFRCKSCHQKIRINEKYADQKIKCPRCKNVNTAPSSSHADTPVPTQPVASENVTIVNFTTPRRHYDGDSPEDTLEQELLLSIESVSDPAPVPDEPDPATETKETSEPVPARKSSPARATAFGPKSSPISKSVVNELKSDSDAGRKPATELPVPPGLSRQKINADSDFIVPPKAKFRFKSLLVIPIILGMVLGSIAIYGYWQNHNSQPQPFMNESGNYGNESRNLLPVSDLVDNAKVEEATPKAEPQIEANKISFVKSMAEFKTAVLDLHSSIKVGMELNEFIIKAMHLSQAYRNIKVSPEIQIFLDVDSSLAVNRFPSGVREPAPGQNTRTEMEQRTTKGGDGAGYQLFQLAQEIRKQTNTLAQQWDANVKISFRNTSTAENTTLEREAGKDQILFNLTRCMDMFIQKHEEYVCDLGFI